MKEMTALFGFLSSFLDINIDKLFDDILNKECKLINKLKKIKLKKRKRKGRK